MDTLAVVSVLVYDRHRSLHSFPTRRSSDLVDAMVPKDFGAEEDEQGGIPFLRFDSEAQECFDAWRTRLENEKRSEEHTSELQSLRHLVCRLLLEKKNQEG